MVLAVQPVLDRLDVEEQFLLFGLVDWIGHLATGAVLVALLRPSRRMTLGILAGSVLIDLDHLPHELGSDVLMGGAARPYTHCLLTLLVVLCLAAVARSELLLGGAIGLAGHLFRDLGSGDVVLLWPLANAPDSVPFWLYVAVLALMAVPAAARSRGRGGA